MTLLKRQRSNPVDILLCYVCMAVLCGVTGCVRSAASPYFAGSFSVSNETDQKIQVKSWANFGVAQPARGFITPGAGNGASTFFPNLDKYPESTVVTWVYVADKTQQLHSQSIELKGVVPKNVDGQTHFTLGEDGVWNVRFEQG